MKKLMMVFFLVFGFAYLGCASTTDQGNTLNNLTSAQVEAYNSNPENTDKIVCKRVAQVGSRVAKRVCQKESTITQKARSAQQAIDRFKERSIQNTIKDD